MIIGLLLELVLGLFSVLTIGISVAPVPAEVLETMTDVILYLSFGVSFLGNYIDVPFFLTLFGIILGMDIAFGLYDFVMWVLKKIPMLGVE